MAAFSLFNSYSSRKIQDGRHPLPLRCYCRLRRRRRRRHRRAPLHTLGKPGQNLLLALYCPRAKAYLISCANIRQPFVINQPIKDGCQR